VFTTNDMTVNKFKLERRKENPATNGSNLTTPQTTIDARAAERAEAATTRKVAATAAAKRAAAATATTKR